MDQSLLVYTNSATISDYITIEFENYFSQDKTQPFAVYRPIEPDPNLLLAKTLDLLFDSLDKLKGQVVWTKKNGNVIFKNGKYYGIYHGGLVQGTYEPNKDLVINLVRDPLRYFNICVGVIDYLFSKALLQDAIFRVHAACVSKENRAILICGTQGAGKTTLLMKFLQSGYRFVADDVTYLKFQDNNFICYPFPKTIKIMHGDIKKFTNLYANLKYHTIITSHGTQKAIIKPEENDILINSKPTPIHQIIIPTISNQQESMIIDLQKDLAFNYLLPSFRGEGLLNIDYITEKSLVEQQDERCQRTVNLNFTKSLSIGKDFMEVQLKNLII